MGSGKLKTELLGKGKKRERRFMDVVKADMRAAGVREEYPCR